MVIFGEISTIRTAVDPCFDRIQNVITPLSKNTALVTESNHLSAVYDLSTLSPIKSWSFPESSPLSSPFVYDKANDLFVAIQNHFTIHVFDTKSEEIKWQTNKRVHCAFSHPLRGTIFVFENGFVKDMSEATKKLNLDESETLLSENESIEWAQVYCENDEQIIVFLYTDKANSFYKIIFNFETHSIINTTVHCLKHKYKFLTICAESCAIIGVDTQGKVMRIEEDKEEFIFELPMNSNANDVISITLITKNKLIIVLKNEQSFKLGVWDLEYKMKIAEIILDLIPIANAITVYRSTIFVCCTKGIIMIPFKKKEISLASVLGKAVASSQSENDADIENSLKDILEKMDFSGPQSKARLQISALKIALKEEMKDNNELVEILKYPFSNNFLIDNLRISKFSLEEILKILRLMNSMLLQFKNIFIIDWICMILDAYFKPLILSSHSETVSVLKDIQKSVDNALDHCERLQEVKQLIEKVGLCRQNVPLELKDIELPKHNRVGDYCIEVIYF